MPLSYSTCVHTRRTVLFTCAWLLLSGQALASLDPSKPLHQFVHQTWTTAQGLPQNSVLAIAQTRDGYLWLGNEEGLVRFDGVNFKTFDKHSGLNSSVVQALLVDHEQNLWIGTNANGLSCYKNGKFKAYDLKNGLSNNTVQALYEDENGVLWIGTDGGGLVRMKDGVFRVYTKADGLADNSVLSITGDGHGTLWVGTHSGLSRLQNSRFVNFNVAQGNDYVRALHIDRQGTLWIAAGDGLFRMGRSDEISRLPTNGGPSGTFVTNRIYEDRAGTLWFGINGGGLARYVNGRLEFYDGNSGSIGNNIFALFEDREGNFWIGSGGGGLTCLKDGSFTTLTKQDGLVSNNILGIYQDDDRNLWIGSDKGVMRLSSAGIQTYSTRNGLPDDLAFSITRDHEGSIWVGTLKGLARISMGAVKIHTIRDGMPADAVISLFTDRRGNVWAGTRSGLCGFTSAGFVHYTTRDGLSNNFVLSMYEDPQGNLWIGTVGGLNQFKNGRFRTYTTRDGLSSDWIWSIVGDRDGTLWLGTSGGGIVRFRNGKFVSITSDKGLYDDSVLSIIDDHLGRFWMSSDKGVFSVSRKQLNDFADGRISSVSPTVYGINDGMKSRECNGGFQPPAWRAEDGRLYFPTNGGLSVVDPAHLKQTDVPAQAIVETVVADGKPADPEQSITIPPGKGQLEFQFTAPSFVAPDKLQFRYMLEGFDKDWISAGTRRVAYYTNIPHGEYKFRVRAGIDGEWGPISRPVTLRLQPHFYQTVTFNIAMVLLGLTLCGAIYRLRVDQLKLREKKLVALVNERTAALQESEQLLRRSRDDLEVRVRERTMELVNANKALEEEIAVRRKTEEQLILAKEAAEAASRAKSDFLANMSHEIRTPINGILGMTDVALSTNLNDEQREYLEIVKFSADSLLGIVNDILDFSKIEARKLALGRTPFELRGAIGELVRSLQVRVKQKGLYLNCQIADKVPNVLIGDPLRLRQVLLNLLDNAIKFTSEGGVTLTVAQEGSSSQKCTLHFAVKDTGIGIPADKHKTIFEAFSQADTSSTRRYGGTGLGLTISYQLASMMDGKLWVESEPGRGSTFHFTATIEVSPTDDLRPARAEATPAEV